MHSSSKPFHFLNTIRKNFSYIPLKQRKTSIFEQCGFNPYHVFPLKEKKRQVQHKFQDPNYKIPILPLAVREKSKNLIATIEKEELTKIKAMGLNKEQIKLGENVEVEYYRSLTGKKLKKLRGIVIGYKNPKSLVYSFRILTMTGGVYASIHYPYYSPLLNSVRVVNKGGFDKKRKIYHYRKVTKFGNRLDEIMKGGRNVSITKSRTRKLNKIESMKESIIIE